MQKVISALEHLERHSSLRDQEHETIETLRTTISHLELEDNKKNEERQRNCKVIIFSGPKQLQFKYEFIILKRVVITP
jgi:hypothetical protein